MLTTALANAVEDPRLSALQMEINALRTKLAQPSPPSSNGTVHAAAVATPLQQIRQGDSL